MPTRSGPGSAAYRQRDSLHREAWPIDCGRAGAKPAPLLAALGADCRGGPAGARCLVGDVSAKLHLFRRAARHRGDAAYRPSDSRVGSIVVDFGDCGNCYYIYSCLRPFGGRQRRFSCLKRV